MEADGLVSIKHSVVEVAWDGQWAEDLDEMAHHLTIKLDP